MSLRISGNLLAYQKCIRYLTYMCTWNLFLPFQEGRRILEKRTMRLICSVEKLNRFSAKLHYREQNICNTQWNQSLIAAFQLILVSYI
jgi:hypothetical protein